MGKNTFIGMPKGIFKGMRGKLGDFISPIVTSFTVPLSSLSYTIPILAFTATDNVGITGYLITESNIPPLPSDPGWNVLPPATYTVATEGAKTLYPWAKDAAGNVSSVYGTPASVFMSVWYGPTWVISGDAVSAVNTPTPAEPELTVNGNMESGNPPSNWVNVPGSNSIMSVAAEHTGGSGSQSLRITRNTTPGAIRQIISVSSGRFLRYSGWMKNNDVSQVQLVLRSLSGVQISIAQVRTSTSWGQSVATCLSIDNEANPNLQLIGSGTTTSGEFDDISLKYLLTADIIASRLFTSPTGTASAKISATPNGTQAGIILNLDSNTSPANFVAAWHNGVNVQLYKCVGGTYTQLINVATTFVAGATLSLAKSGTSYSVFYNGVQRGTTQTISDAGIISNTRHGLFSTYSGNTLTNWSFA